MPLAFRSRRLSAGRYSTHCSSNVGRFYTEPARESRSVLTATLKATVVRVDAGAGLDVFGQR
jgi:hypothetical protein